MPFLMHIAFDNPHRFKRRVYYFAYSAIRFKLIQNDPRRWSDVLVTIIDSHSSPAVQQAYTAAGEFVGALSWAMRVPMTVRYIGGPGTGRPLTLRRARCAMRVFPELHYLGQGRGFSLPSLPKITTPQQVKALTLIREARGSNKAILSILLYWQVMELGSIQPLEWIKRVLRRRPMQLSRIYEDLHNLPLAGRTLGDYLLNDCRHAIAHIRRRPGLTPLLFDNAEENRRLGYSLRILEELAHYYVSDVLGLSGRVVLVRRRGRGFPEYLDPADHPQDWFAVLAG